MANTGIDLHKGDYVPNAWESYTIEELGQWVALLAKRSSHRSNEAKRLKDLEDAQNYLDMMQAKINSLKA
jgi:hypothetical protein